jgi:ADP-ribose pyrophosphatase
MYVNITETYNLSELAVAQGYPNRQYVANDNTDWDFACEGYCPEDYTSAVVLGADWADGPTPSRSKIISRLVEDDKVLFDANGAPLNPNGRSGIRGRGLLGAWGPNYLGICVVMTPQDEVLTLHHNEANFTALPGGYRSGNESIVEAATRELREEIAPAFMPRTIERVGKLFFVPDPKTTDNAWLMAGIAAVRVESKQEVSIENDGNETRDGAWMSVSEAVEVLFPAHAHAVQLALRHFHESQE